MQAACLPVAQKNITGGWAWGNAESHFVSLCTHSERLRTAQLSPHRRAAPPPSQNRLGTSDGPWCLQATQDKPLHIRAQTGSLYKRCGDPLPQDPYITPSKHLARVWGKQVKQSRIDTQHLLEEPLAAERLLAEENIGCQMLTHITVLAALEGHAGHG